MTDKEDLLKTLHKIGFSEKEAAVYLTLLELSEALPSTISRITNVKRSTAYLILEQLQKKGLATSIKKGGHLYFQSCKPDFLIANQRKKYEEIKEQLTSLEQVIPELNLLHKDFTTTPQMSVYKGDEGIIHILEDSLSAKGEIYCWSNTGLASDTALNKYHPTFLKKKIERKIHSKCLFTYDKSGLQFKKNSKKELREVYLIPQDKYPFKNEINIYNDKTSIISLTDRVGVIIQNQDMADSQRALFNLGFEYAKSFEKDLLTQSDIRYLRGEKLSSKM
ncbi:MAG: helix-turn-helix domain-containing protein [Patescibacteria group bacterium]